MKSNFLALWIALTAVSVTGCSVEISSTSAARTAAPPTRAPQPTPSAAEGLATDEVERGGALTATAGADNESTDALTEAAAKTPTGASPTSDLAEWHAFPHLDPGALEFELVPGWEDLGLSGSVLFLSFTENAQAVVVFDFDTGIFSPLYTAPENSWVLSVSAPPEKDRLLIAFAPPPPEGESQFGYADLYLLSPDAAAPELLLARETPLESYFSAFYSNSGADIYFSWFFPDGSVDYGYRYHINRLAAGSGAVSTVVEDAYWGTISADDTRLAYVVLDPSAAAEDPAPLLVKALDGSPAQEVLDPGRFPTVDAPFFSPDGAYLYYSAVSETPAGLSLFDRLMGVSIASAHNVPSDWWRVGLETGSVERITELFDQRMFADFSPGGAWIGFISSTGLWVMRPDGSALTQVMTSDAFYGTLEWLE